MHGELGVGLSRSATTLASLPGAVMADGPSEWKARIARERREADWRDGESLMHWIERRGSERAELYLHELASRVATAADSEDVWNYFQSEAPALAKSLTHQIGLSRAKQIFI